MFFLRSVKGKYPVGATTFLAPITQPKSIGNAKLRSASNVLEPALPFEEVVFTAFYPASIDGQAEYGLDWLLRPVKQSVRGYARFTRVPSWLLWPVFFLVGRLIKIPAYSNAPILQPTAHSDKPGGEHQDAWPLVIFSHGLGGSRTTYSQVCMRLAASGKVVLAVEHRDGTGPVVINSEGREKLYVQYEDAVYDADLPQSTQPLPFRSDQLELRRHEIYQTYTAFRQLVYGIQKIAAPDSKLQTIDGVHIDWASWQGAVNCDENVSLVGHSFGGATLLSILSTPPPDTTYPLLPVTRALALDPWLEPLPSPGPIPYLPPSTHNVTPSPPPPSTEPNDVDSSSTVVENIRNSSPPARFPELVVINGEGFTLWSEHFDRLQDLMRTWAPQGRRLVTIVRARHHYFSDVNLLPIVRRREPIAEPIMDVIGAVSVGFLDGRVDEVLQGEVETRGMKIEWYEEKGKRKKRLIGEAGDVVIH